MTVQEAIKTIKNNVCVCCKEDCQSCAYGKAIESMEKQIPKTPNIEGDGYADGHLVYDTWICPNCEEHYEIDYDDYDYCPKCGQAINKEVMNEDD